MKNIVIFIDGTLNTMALYDAKQYATNIRKAFNLISQHSHTKSTSLPSLGGRIKVLSTETKKT